jgi:Ser/Thr protein kinase RdoA (MazF antagonist)
VRINDLLPRKKPEYGNCHGDHHGYNVNIDKNGTMTVFDFDCYGYGWRAYDISVFLWNRSFDWSRTATAKRTRRWNAFLN